MKMWRVGSELLRKGEKAGRVGRVGRVGRRTCGTWDVWDVGGIDEQPHQVLKTLRKEGGYDVPIRMPDAQHEQMQKRDGNPQPRTPTSGRWSVTWSCPRLIRVVLRPRCLVLAVVNGRVNCTCYRTTE